MIPNKSPKKLNEPQNPDFNKAINPIPAPQALKSAPSNTPIPTPIKQAQSAQPTPQPQPDPRKVHIKFNQDNTVEYTSGNKTFMLSKDEYNNFLNDQKAGWSQNPKIQDLLDSEQYRAMQIKAQDTQKKEMFANQIAQDQQQAQNQESQNQLNELLTANPLMNQVNEYPNSDMGHGQTNDLVKTQGGVLAAMGAGALGGAATGATVGAVSGLSSGGLLSVPAAVAGAVGGAAIGAFGSLFAKVSSEKRQAVAATMADYRGAKTNMKNIFYLANHKIITPEQAIEAWNNQIRTISIAQANLKYLTRTDTQKFLSNGVDELEELEQFKQMIPYNTMRLQQYLLNPDASYPEPLQENAQ